MSAPLLIVDATVDPDCERDWNQWYEAACRHELESAPEVFVRRYLGASTGSHRYKTIYSGDLPLIKPLDWGRFAGHVEATARQFSPLDAAVAGDLRLSGHLLIVDATIEAASEDDWNAWYDDVHLPEILDCPGFVRARRFLSDTGGGRRYVAIYEVVSPAALQSDEFLARRGWGPFLGRVQPTARLYTATDHNPDGTPPANESTEER